MFGFYAYCVKISRNPAFLRFYGLLKSAGGRVPTLYQYFKSSGKETDFHFNLNYGIHYEQSWKNEQSVAQSEGNFRSNENFCDF